MPSKTTTIKDIANKLGMHHSTVSRALRDHPEVSQKTKERVLEAMKKTNYIPNGLAVNLRNRKSSVIGVLLPNIDLSFFSNITSIISNLAAETGYSIMMCQSNESYEEEVKNARMLLANRIAGLIVCVSHATRKTNHLKAFQERNIPTVYFDRVPKGLKVSKVTVDQYNGAFEAVSYLINSGYKRIACLADASRLSVFQDRLKGCKEALKNNNLPCPDELVVLGSLWKEDGIKGADKLLSLKKRPDAIFCVNDTVATGVIMRLHQKGLRVPDDIAVVGFDDDPVTALLNPPLTTVAQPKEQIAKSVFTLLMEQIKSPRKSTAVKTEKLKAKLIIREST